MDHAKPTASKAIRVVDLRGKANPKQRNTTNAQRESPPYFAKNCGSGSSFDRHSKPIPITSVMAKA